jgi:hypothetical protein
MQTMIDERGGRRVRGLENLDEEHDQGCDENEIAPGERPGGAADHRDAEDLGCEQRTRGCGAVGGGFGSAGEEDDDVVEDEDEKRERNGSQRHGSLLLAGTTGS